MSIELRPYVVTDCVALLEIINYNIINSTALYDYHPRTLTQQEAIFDDKLQKDFPILVAVLDNKIVGFGYYSEFRFREAYRFTVEHSVYVHPDYQGLKIGQKLLETLIETAKNQKLHTMIAVIDSENQGSVKFHEKLGFETVGIIKESVFKFNRWLHSVFMQKMLD